MSSDGNYLLKNYFLFIYRIQQVALTSDDVEPTHKCNLQSIAIALLALISRVTGINNLLEYTQKIIDARKEEAPYFLPPLLDPKKTKSKMNANLPHLSIDKMALAECLQNAGMDFNRLQTGAPYALNQLDNPAHRHSWVESVSNQMTQRNSSADLTAYNADADSITSSPGMAKVQLLFYF